MKNRKYFYRTPVKKRIRNPALLLPGLQTSAFCRKSETSWIVSLWSAIEFCFLS